MGAATFSTPTPAPCIAASFVWTRAGRFWWYAASSVFRCSAERRLGSGKAETSRYARARLARRGARRGFAGPVLHGPPHGLRDGVGIRHTGRGEQHPSGRLGGTGHAG